jgi:hypothetical protein
VLVLVRIDGTPIQRYILQLFYGKMVFAKLKNFFAKLIFFPPNFFLLKKSSLFQNTKKKNLAGKKST